jgi:predicted negative regulator of RcsB-dependent stress response
MVSNVRATMWVSVLLGLTLSVVLVWMSAAPAQAQTVEEVNKCQAEIAEVTALLELDSADPNYINFANEKDRSGLIAKLESASEKLERGKYEDALANLTSVSEKVNTLVAQGKLDQADANDILLPEINDAIACVQGLIDAQATSAAA